MLQATKNGHCKPLGFKDLRNFATQWFLWQQKSTTTFLLFFPASLSMMPPLWIVTQAARPWHTYLHGIWYHYVLEGRCTGSHWSHPHRWPRRHKVKTGIHWCLGEMGSNLGTKVERVFSQTLTSIQILRTSLVNFHVCYKQITNCS